MALTSQALLGFLLLPLWPSPSLALLRHSWELFGAPCGWQLVCWTSPRPPALLRMSHWGLEFRPLLCRPVGTHLGLNRCPPPLLATPRNL